MTDQQVVYPIPRRTFRVVLGAISFCLVLIILVGATGLLWINSVAKENRQSIHRLNRLTNPTPQQFREDLKRGLKRCLREPECRRLFPKIRVKTGRGRVATFAVHSIRDSGPANNPSPTSIPSPARRAPTHSDGSPTQPGGGSHGSGGSGGGGSGSGGSPPANPPPPAPKPKPPVDVTVPAPITVCSPALGVNC